MNQPPMAPATAACQGDAGFPTPDVSLTPHSRYSARPTTRTALYMPTKAARFLVCVNVKPAMESSFDLMLPLRNKNVITSADGDN